MDFSKEEKVKETVIYGSLYEALYKNFIKLEDVLEYLLDNSPQDEYQRRKMCIAYRIVCIFTKKQFIRKNHFICLTDNEDYISIYSLSFPSIILEEHQDMSVEIFKKVQKVFKNFIQENYKTRFFYILCDISDEKLRNEDHEILAAIRSIKNIPKIYHDYNAFISTDYVDILETIPENIYIEELGSRCLYLKDCAPLYWENVGLPLYYPLVEKKFSEAKRFTREMINTYNYCFPDLFSEKIKNRTELFLHLSKLDREVCSYILGFPIHKYIPSITNLEKTLEILDEIGIEKYCEMVNETIKNVEIDENVKIANPENVHFDKIESFNSFDVVKYYTDNEDGESIKHLFRFTRPEFENILKEGKNFYTGKELPIFVIQEIKCRQEIARIYNLPKSKPLNELLKNKEDETESISSEVEEVEDDEEEEFDELEDDEDARHVFGRLRNPRTGEESVFRFPVPEYFDDSDADEMIHEALESQGMEFLGRLECGCPVCEQMNDSVD